MMCSQQTLKKKQQSVCEQCASMTGYKDNSTAE